MLRSMSDGMHAYARSFGIACVTEAAFVHVQNHAVFYALAYSIIKIAGCAIVALSCLYSSPLPSRAAPARLSI